MNATGLQHIRVEGCTRGVRTITLNRPNVRNAFDDITVAELTKAFQDVEDSTRLIVIRGAGPVFCAGGDLRWMARMGRATWDENLADARLLSAMLKALASVAVPTVAVVQGAAVGGGVGILCACDIVVAADDSIYRISEPQLGLVPACIAPFVVAKIGASHARYLCLSGATVSAAHALALGLLHQVVPDHCLEASVESAVTRIVGADTAALRETKSLLLQLNPTISPEVEPASLLANFRANRATR